MNAHKYSAINHYDNIVDFELHHVWNRKHIVHLDQTESGCERTIWKQIKFFRMTFSVRVKGLQTTDVIPPALHPPLRNTHACS